MNKSKSIPPNFKKVGVFLKSLQPAEYIYLKHCIGMRNSINALITENNISKQEACAAFEIASNKYNDFVKGNYEYTLKDMAKINALHLHYAQLNLHKTVPIKTVDSK
jgi:predicted XRE-type DNA-binding protein